MGTLDIIILIISILLIALVLLQSGKAESASQAITGGLDLFSDRKERGAELFISRLTMTLGAAFIVLTFISSYFM